MGGDENSTDRLLKRPAFDWPPDASEGKKSSSGARRDRERVATKSRGREKEVERESNPTASNTKNATMQSTNPGSSYADKERQRSQITEIKKRESSLGGSKARHRSSSGLPSPTARRTANLKMSSSAMQ